MLDEQQPESFEVDEVNPVASHNRERFILMGFEPIEALMLVSADAHPTDVEKALKDGCPKHRALEIWL